LGRFVQADTIVPDPGNPIDWDRYSYAGNNPVIFIDPSGHKLCSEMFWEEDCQNTDEQIYRTLVGRGQSPKIIRLPVEKEDTEWIQYFGGTESAYQDHLAFINGEANWNYDGYCQGLHCGLDFGAAWDTSVHAGIYGEVLYAGPMESGLGVTIKIGDYQIRYEHLSETNVKRNDLVTPDTLIGGVGNLQGDSSLTNTHLHLEVRFSSTGHAEWKDRISNPLLQMSVDMVNDLKEIAASQYYRSSVEFHSPMSQDPLQQPSPIIRGGGVLW
jgi:murein DD-endopeptidase MepM/ murein hydrolase activator NlpD